MIAVQHTSIDMLWAIQIPADRSYGNRASLSWVHYTRK